MFLVVDVSRVPSRLSGCISVSLLVPSPFLSVLAAEEDASGTVSPASIPPASMPHASIPAVLDAVVPSIRYLYLYLCIYIYIYIYVCVCVCVCVAGEQSGPASHPSVLVSSGLKRCCRRERAPPLEHSSPFAVQQQQS